MVPARAPRRRRLPASAGDRRCDPHLVAPELAAGVLGALMAAVRYVRGGARPAAVREVRLRPRGNRPGLGEYLRIVLRLDGRAQGSEQCGAVAGWDGLFGAHIVEAGASAADAAVAAARAGGGDDERKGCRHFKHWNARAR